MISSTTQKMGEPDIPPNYEAIEMSASSNFEMAMITSIRRFSQLCASHHRLRQDRDGLLAAAKAAEEILKNGGSGASMAIVALHDAIAKAERAC